jgi:hypothetical protein
MRLRLKWSVVEINDSSMTRSTYADKKDDHVDEVMFNSVPVADKIVFNFDVPSHIRLLVSASFVAFKVTCSSESNVKSNLNC